MVRERERESLIICRYEQNVLLNISLMFWFINKYIFDKLRLYTHTKYDNNSCVSWAAIEFWYHRVAFKQCVILNVL